MGCEGSKDSQVSPFPVLPDGFEVGKVVYYKGESKTFPSGNQVVYGQKGEVKQPGAGEGQLGVLFSGNKGIINCAITLLEIDSPPPPIPGGFEVGEIVFFKGPSQTIADDKKLIYGQHGQVVGVGTLPDEKEEVGLIAVDFRGAVGTVNCATTKLSKTHPGPLPGNYQVGDKVYYYGRSTTSPKSDKFTLSQGQEGEIVGATDGLLDVLFADVNNVKTVVSCRVSNLSRTNRPQARSVAGSASSCSSAPPTPLAGGFQVHDTVFFKDTDHHFASGNTVAKGQQGEVTAIGPGFIAVLFPNNSNSVNCFPDQLTKCSYRQSFSSKADEIPREGSKEQNPDPLDGEGDRKLSNVSTNLKEVENEDAERIECVPPKVSDPLVADEAMSSDLVNVELRQVNEPGEAPSSAAAAGSRPASPLDRPLKSPIQPDPATLEGFTAGRLASPERLHSPAPPENAEQSSAPPRPGSSQSGQGSAKQPLNGGSVEATSPSRPGSALQKDATDCVASSDNAISAEMQRPLSSSSKGGSLQLKNESAIGGMPSEEGPRPGSSHSKNGPAASDNVNYESAEVPRSLSSHSRKESAIGGMPSEEGPRPGSSHSKNGPVLMTDSGDMYIRPKYWSGGDSGSPWNPIPVSDTEREFLCAAMTPSTSLEGRDLRHQEPAGYTTLEFVHAWRVENELWWSEYAETKKQILQQIQDLSTKDIQMEGVQTKLQDKTPAFFGLDPRVNEIFLLFGADSHVVHNVLATGFHQQMDSLKGPGVRLAEDIERSDQDTTPGLACEVLPVFAEDALNLQDNLHFFLVCRVVFGNFLKSLDEITCIEGKDLQLGEGDKGLRQGEGAHHGLLLLLGDKFQRYQEFIVYDGQQVYPEYLVAYKRT